MQSIKKLPPCDRPRERLVAKGVAALTDEELLQILIGSGSKKHTARKLAKSVLNKIKSWNNIELNELTQIPGIGVAKASTIISSIEFARRRIQPLCLPVKCSTDTLPLLRQMIRSEQEHLICISLNGAMEIIHSRIVTIGLVNSAQVHPREVFAEPLVDRATAVIIAHNHPAGDCTPSAADIRVTERLYEAACILGIEFMDHLIFSYSDYFSFRAAELVPGLLGSAESTL